METIKTYTGTDTVIANAFRELEIFIGDAENESDMLADGAVRALNTLIDAHTAAQRQTLGNG
jgi:hypothetical protein